MEVNGNQSTKDWLLIFDRDNTLNQDMGYVHKIEDFKWCEGIQDLLISLSSIEFHSAIASNQGGIGLGLFSKDDAERFNFFLVSQAQKFGFRFDAVVFCPHALSSSANCYYRKPNPGMIFALRKFFSVVNEKIIFVGDSESDRLAAQNAGVIFFNVKEKNLATKIKKKINP
jgi:D-glycero-D-manno-heptose 1,7-bisphosphate phosphatase